MSPTAFDPGVDYAALYRTQMQRARRVPKAAGAWDERAAGYAAKAGHGAYVPAFIARMDLTGARTLLDVGCGPGTLALPLARRLDHVTALDYSAGMLEQLRLRAGAEGVANVAPLQRAWEDDWAGVPVCDIAIASRSTAVADLGAALAKLHAHARLRAYVSYLSGGHFIDPRIVELVGAREARAPDHPVVMGMLRQMDVRPRLDFIETPSRLAGCRGFDEFAERVAWTTGPFGPEARERLRRWYEADAGRARRGGAPMRWAFIGWDVAR